MGRRRRAREHALQVLFQIDVTGAPSDEVFREFWRDRGTDDEMRDFTEGLVRGVLERQRDLDRWIAGSAEHWRLDRMAVVDRNVLRMAVLEMVRAPRLAPAIAIDEAVEVAKKFGSAESGGFINGVLDDLRRRLERGEIDPGVEPTVKA